MQNTENNSILNVAGYKFVSLNTNQLLQLRTEFKTKTLALNLKGTILLSIEGINLSLSGFVGDIENFLNFLSTFHSFKAMTFQRSWSLTQPFQRMLVRIKKEIITMGKVDISPEKTPVPYLEPLIFHQWLEEKKDMVVLDTRNRYEVEVGTFNNAIDLNLDHFSHFPQAVQQLPEGTKDKTVVTFCTGGIRCEKAALWLIQLGFKEVYQLQGGIINYFNQCGNNYFQGTCFVFDDRSAIESEK